MLVGVFWLHFLDLVSPHSFSRFAADKKETNSRPGVYRQTEAACHTAMLQSHISVEVELDTHAPNVYTGLTHKLEVNIIYTLIKLVSQRFALSHFD